MKSCETESQSNIEFEIGKLYEFKAIPKPSGVDVDLCFYLDPTIYDSDGNCKWDKIRQCKLLYLGRSFLEKYGKTTGGPQFHTWLINNKKYYTSIKATKEKYSFLFIKIV
jgi:hypothetical protein